MQRRFFSGKSKDHEVKYEVLISFDAKKIISCSHAFVGSAHDLTIFRESGFSEHLLESEKILADKGYIGDPSFLTPFRGHRDKLSEEQKAWNKIVAKRRIAIEHLFSRVKVFKFTDTDWRHEITKHEMCFLTLLNIINVDLVTRPIEIQEEYH